MCSEVSFNLSHSGDMAVLAVALGHDVGVDIEWMHGARAAFLDAERLLSRRELTALRSLPEIKRELAFLTC